MTIGSFSEKKIREFVEKHHMLTKGNGVVIGLSGGPDSVCLFFVLLNMAKDYDLTLSAVHVNHCIRGDEADSDENYVRDLCRCHDIPLTVLKTDVIALAKVNGRPVEEEARIVRYEAFEDEAKVLEAKGCKDVKIAIAHNANDNAETVLFHVARGCGLDGLCGIPATRGRIIRPLLMVSKADIVGWLKDNNIKYCIDKTNTDTAYDRNRIRHNIMPEMEQVNSGVLEHMGAMTEILSEASDYIGTEVIRLLAECVKDDCLQLKKLKGVHPFVRKSVLKEYLSGFMPFEKDVSLSHINQIEDVIYSDGEKRVSLPHGKCAILSYEMLIVTNQEYIEPQGYENCVKMRVFEAITPLSYPVDTYTKWFDYDKITENVAVRNRKEKDYLIINSLGQKKSLQDYFVNEKIPKYLRDSVPLVCDGDHVMWVIGHRISEYYKVTDNTKKVLEIIYGGNIDE